MRTTAAQHLEQEAAYASANPQDVQVAGIGSLAGLLRRSVGKVVEKAHVWGGDSDTARAYRRTTERAGPSAIELDDMAVPPVAEPGAPPAGAVPPAEIIDPTAAPGGAPDPTAAPGAAPEPTSPLVSPEMTTDDALDLATDAYAAGKPEFRTAERNINLSYADPVDEGDMGRILDATAAKYEMGEAPRTFETVEAQAADANKVLEKVLTGEQIGLMTDVQKFAARQIMVDLSDRAVAIADDIAAGNHNKIRLLEYRKVMNSVVAWQRFLQKDIKETARALGQQKMIAGAVDSKSIAAINDMVQVGGSTASIVKQAQNHVAAAEDALREAGATSGSASVAAADATIKKWSYIGIASEYWKNNLLSGPQTHFVNMTSNLFMNGYHTMLLRPLAAGVGELRTKVLPEKFRWGAQDRVTSQEAYIAAMSSSTGALDGVKAFVHTVTSETGESAMLAGSKFTEGRSDIRALAEGRGRGAKLAADAATISFRLLQAEDDLFKTLAYRQELTALATRDGVQRGLEGDALNAHMIKVFNDPPADMHDAAAQFSKELTFTDQATGGLFGMMQEVGRKAVNSFPALSFITPFITTPTNIVKYAVNNTALSLIAKKTRQDILAGGSKADMAIARVTAGSAFMATIWGLYEQGIVTGAGPLDDGQKRMLRQLGWEPLSFRFGDTYVSMERGDPFAMMMSMIATTMDAAKYSKDPEFAQSMLVNSMFIIGEHMLDGTYMRGMQTFLEAVKRRDASYFVASLATGMVPYSSAVATVERGVDPEFRRISMDKMSSPSYKQYTDEIWQRIQTRIPGLSQDMRPARNWDGTPIMPEGGVAARMVLPVRIGKGKDDPATLALWQNGVSVGDPGPIVTFGQLKFSLPGMDNNRGRFYDAFIVRVGTARRQAVNEIMTDPEYQAAEGGPGSDRAIALEGALRKARHQGLLMFLAYDAKAIAEDTDPAELNKTARAFLLNVDVALEQIQARLAAGKKVEGAHMRGQRSREGLAPPPHVKNLPKPPWVPHF